MPYIPKEDREYLAGSGVPTNAGHLNYRITLLIKEYVEHHGLNYQTCNDIMGALTGAQQEFYRRTVAPYEDEKIKSNGDV